MHSNRGSGGIAGYGSEAQRRELLAKVARATGRSSAALAPLTEADSLDNDRAGAARYVRTQMA